MAATAGARLAEVEGTWLGAVQLVPTVALLAALAAAVEIGLSGSRRQRQLGVVDALDAGFARASARA